MRPEPGLSITAETARCQWHGESMDYSHAIESMQFLEREAAAPSVGVRTLTEVVVELYP